MAAAYRILAVTLAAAILSSSGPASAQTEDGEQRTLWLNLKKQLTGADGEEYFNANVKNSVLPPLKGILISALCSDGISKIMLGLTDSKNPEVTLILHNGDVKVTCEPNAPIEFQGIAIEFTKNPFMLTFDVLISGIKGLTKD